jgi:uncharacterized protein with HEPN domain
MRDAAREAMAFTAGRQRSHLDDDRMLVLALVKAIEIIGEAASQVGQSTRDTLPAIPWPSIVAMRHRLVHAYFDINLDTVWNTVIEDLPPLLSQIEEALSGEPRPQE